MKTIQYTDSKGNLRTLDTERTVAQARDIVKAFSGESFAKDIVSTVEKTGRMSDAQRFWIHSEALRIQGFAAPRQTRRGTPVDTSLVDAIVENARQRGLVRVSLRFGNIVVKPRAKGGYNVTDRRQTEIGNFGEKPKWWGRVEAGETTVSEPAILAEVVAFFKDPVGSAKLHGTQTGSCCFCGRELTTKESVAVGYGPVCADKFGLPWGDETVKTHVVEDLAPAEAAPLKSAPATVQEARTAPEAPKETMEDMLSPFSKAERESIRFAIADKVGSKKRDGGGMVPPLVLDPEPWDVFGQIFAELDRAKVAMA